MYIYLNITFKTNKNYNNFIKIPQQSSTTKIDTVIESTKDVTVQSLKFSTKNIFIQLLLEDN